MTITEYIQDVSGDIDIQKAEMIRLESRRIDLALALYTSTALLLANLLLMAPTLSYTLPFFILTMLSGLQWGLVHKKMVQTSVLLVQNMFYREMVIEETYAGRNDPDQDRGVLPSAKALEALPETRPASAY